MRAGRERGEGSAGIGRVDRVEGRRGSRGKVLDKIPGSGSGSVRVGVLKYMIKYFQVSFLLLGISGYVGYFRVFLGLPIYTKVLGSFLWVPEKST